MNIKDYIQKSILLMDGAMGTYYSDLTKIYEMSELANLKDKEVIANIHNEYIDAGAKMIRTNTFSANTVSLNLPKEDIKKIIQSGFKIAKESVSEKDVYVACSIGPIPETIDSDGEKILEEYYWIIDNFLEVGADVFLFETFSHAEYIKDLTNYIIEKNPEAEVIAQFSVNAHGYSKKGISMSRILEVASNIPELTAYGFNCIIGAGHMYNLLKDKDITEHNLIIAPNAGYPERIYDRTVYMDNAVYFSDQMIRIASLGTKIVGGCCGTTPKHIQLMAEGLKNIDRTTIQHKQKKSKTVFLPKKNRNKFYEKLTNNEFVIAVELDPPFHSDVTKLMEAANILKVEGADIITLADSPLGKVRLDSLMMAAKVQREVGIEVMPHLCCRDKNTIAIQAGVMAAYVEGIRNFLLVTGDPLQDELRGEIRGVFNMNSVKLMEFIRSFNETIQNEDYYRYGGALNPKLPNTEKVIEKVLKKKEAGAEFLLTQPVYTLEDMKKIEYIREKTGMKILGGIMPFVSYRNAWFIHNEFAGMNIPDHILNQFREDMTKEEGEAVGIQIATQVAKEMRLYVDGFYFMTPFNRATMIAKIMKQI